MESKKLISPEFLVETEKFEISRGMEVEVFSSREARADWGRVELTSQFYGTVDYEDMEPAEISLGYDGDYDTLVSGYCRKAGVDSWKEILIRDEMILLERINLKQTFVDCTPQDVIRYILVQAGVADYKLPDEDYGKRPSFIVREQNGIAAIEELNSAWGLDCDFFFRDRVFYWGCKPKQEKIYVLEEDNNILSLEKYGDMYEVETLGVPWIHHSQTIEISHSKYSGSATVEKTIIRSNEKGYTRMYIYFR